MFTIQEIKLLIEKLEKAKASDFIKIINDNLTELKNIKEVIERRDKESATFSNKGASWHRQDLKNKAQNETDPLLYLEIKNKIWHFAKTNMYNSLEIGPGNAEFSTMFLAWRNQYFLDIMWDIEKNVRFRFERGGQQKYIKFFKTDGHHCGNVPQGAVNFIFSWDTFVFFTVDQIKSYLKSMQDVLIPGGYVMLQYADCHFDYDLQMAKKDYWAYNNQSEMEKSILETGYDIVEMGQFKPGANYAIFKKPGNVNPTVYKMSELLLD